MIRHRLTALTLIVAASASTAAVAQDESDDWRTIEIETTEVTAPDVSITPDGEWLIFTLLGHLFRLPVEGGDAELPRLSHLKTMIEKASLTIT
ncbi:MAG: hypothetical protein KAJ42_12190 [Gemmatimonadetes bacterium]|nr:hypothetical protein [Gemmatimonadota bacterium]